MYGIRETFGIILPNLVNSRHVWREFDDGRYDYVLLSVWG